MIDHSTPSAGVLVGVDGSPATAGAVRWAAREAARRHLPLDLVQVLPPSERPHDELRSPSGRAHALLERARRVAGAVAPQVPVRLSVVDGVAGPALVATASRARLLVIGARPGSGLAELGVGRTVAHVMGHAACPVIVVPPDWEAAEDEASRGVLVGVDGSVEALGAIGFSADVANRSRSTLVVASVTPRLGGPDEETRRRYLAEAVAGLATPYPELVVREVVRRGRPSEALLDIARSGVSLVALGARARGPVGGALLGSTSQQLVRFAPCPVAVLPPQAAATWARPERTYAGEGA
ncbi:universal stress protein [Actinomycetospora callitridis]|uniref:universal stress protein n=1 Tax=Actinomycetospora callitridis TaxID=913944 RepID=UPI0023662D9F|nr:universal stress protein [Actinomycetospora callitridis]MDD7918803.1 universal stress protein [Actinomycetospora callitridis]